MEEQPAFPSEMQCPKCSRLLWFTPRPDTQHYGCVRCPEHGFLWIPKPSEEKKPRRKTNSDLASKLPPEQQSLCAICCRTKTHLASLRPAVVLQVHHIWPVEKGGTDDLSNLQLLCSECHAEVHRRREAFARYQTSSEEAA
jgi:5-methylcytosine-specific restriction endonuclease McrA